MYNTAAVRRISAAKRKPACAVFINADARIERRRAILKPRHILINQRCAESGGTVIASGTPEEVAANPVSYTGAYLKKLL